MTHRLTFCLALAVSIFAAPLIAADDDLNTEARGVALDFGQTLQKQLQTSMMTVGPSSSIRMCNSQAPAIAAQLSQHSQWNVRRTSTKNRNPNNAADAWESQILATFQDKLDRGAPLENLEHGEVQIINGKKSYRYMKAIGIKEPCLNCHGAHISGEVSGVIKGFYPQDKATGYKIGELRGAFSLYKVLED